MYQALYRKYRPKSFEDVVGQKIIIKTLTNSILNDKITHAYLFTGPRGTGKTSIAKILSKIVNCTNLNGADPCNECSNCIQISNKQSTDIIEIDAASNNGVDEIRNIRDKVSLVPSFGKYKVYIIDEVHMLTQSAFNALLKTLEEPPKHIIFILATTEPHKIPLTILSRCQRFDFKKVSISEIEKRLNYICEQEKIEIDKDAISLIAKLSDGGMRDSISLLDQLTAYSNDKISVDDVNEIYGVVTSEELLELILNIFSDNMGGAFKIIEKYDDDGKNLVKILENIIEFLKNVLIYYNSSDYFTDSKQKQMYAKVCDIIDEEKIYTVIEILLNSVKSSKVNNNVRLIFELAIVKISNLRNEHMGNNHISVPIIEEKKQVSQNLSNSKKNSVIDEKVKSKLEELKKIRVDNTLVNFEKKEFVSFKKQMESINEYLLNPEVSSIVSLIMDGELKAKGNENLIFTYKLKNLEKKFNSTLVEIENAFYKLFGMKYKPIAVYYEEWEPIKEKFNDNVKSKSNFYTYIDDKKLFDEIFKSSDEIDLDESNSIENMFKDVIIYN